MAGTAGLYTRGCFDSKGTTGLYARGFTAAGSDTGDHGSGGHGSQTGGTIQPTRHRRGRRGFLVNPWAGRKSKDDK